MTFVPGFLPSTSALHFSNAWPNLPLLTVQTPFGPVKIGNTALGVCGGMCYVARDLFEARALPPDATSAPSSTDDPVYQYTVARFFDSLTPGAIATYYALMDPALPDHETELSQIGLAPHGRSWIMINQAWPKIKTDIDGGHPSPIGLVLTKSLNPGDLGLNHVVVVYGYDLVGTDLTLHIYDPNFANNNSQTIRLNIGNPMEAITVTSNHANLNCFFRLDDYTAVLPWQRAVCISQTVPPSPVQAGHNYQVSITMKNTGITTWTSGGSNPQRLGSQNPQDNILWGLNRVNVPKRVVPGDSAVFNFAVTAPLTPGVRPLQWRMLQEGITWFGDFTPEIDYSVQLAQMTAEIQPYPVVLGQPRTYTVQVLDAVTHQPINAKVMVNGVQVAQSNVPFNYTFALRLARVFDAETRTYIPEKVPPTVAVTASGYTSVTVDLGLDAFASAVA